MADTDRYLYSGLSELDATRMVKEANRDIYGRSLYDIAQNQITRQEQEGLSSLNKSYDQEILNAYGSMIGADASVRKSNIFSGYKNYTIDENQKNFEATMANAYNAYLQNRSALEENATKAREQIQGALENEANMIDKLYGMVDKYHTSMEDWFANLPESDKRIVLSGIQPEGDWLTKVDGTDAYKETLPASLAEVYGNMANTFNLVSDGQWRGMEEIIAGDNEHQLTDEEIMQLYRNAISGNDVYTFSKFVRETDPELYKQMKAQGMFETGEETFVKTLGGSLKGQTISEALNAMRQKDKEAYQQQILDSVDATKEYETFERNRDKDESKQSAKALKKRNELLMDKYQDITDKDTFETFKKEVDTLTADYDAIDTFLKGNTVNARVPEFITDEEIFKALDEAAEGYNHNGREMIRKITNVSGDDKAIINYIRNGYIADTDYISLMSILRDTGVFKNLRKDIYYKLDDIVRNAITKNKI